MSEIVVTAAPYCFGPTSKALCIASELARLHQITYVGAQPGISLARAANCCPVIELTDRDQWSGPALNALLRSRCLISALESRAILVASKHGIPVVFFDTLLWLRPTPPPHFDLASVYVAQSFFRRPTESVLKALKAFEGVGAVFSQNLDALHARGASAPGIRLLVNFGGLTSPAMLPAADIDYVTWILRVLQMTGLPSSRLTVCLPIQLSRLIPVALHYLPDANIRTPTLDEFHALLSDCSVLITIPGLETVLEAMYLGRPIIFLPPHNATQAIQLRVYRENGVGWCVPASSLELALDGCCSDLHEATRVVQGLNKKNLSDVGTTARIAQHLCEHSHHLMTNTDCAEVVVADNTTLLHALGTNGRESVADIVRSLV